MYSLGVVMYRMLSGTAPFQANASEQYAMALTQLTTDPAPLRSQVADLPAGLDELVGRMLSKDPALRPAANELAGQLRGLCLPAS